MFKKVSESELYNNGVISLTKVELISDSGEKFTRDVVRHLGAVNIVPITKSGMVILVKQFRAALGDDVIEIPAGKRDKLDELPHETAIRELEEEMGLRCSSLISLGSFYNSPGFTDELSYSFLALGLSICEPIPQSIEESGSSLVAMNIDNLTSYVSSGVIRDGKTIIGLSRARDYLSLDPPGRKDLFPDFGSQESIGQDSPEIETWLGEIDLV